MPDRAAVAKRPRDVVRVERRDRLRGLRHLAAEDRAEAAVVRLQLVAAQLVGGGDEAHRAHVQLLAHHVHEPLDRRALARVRDHHRLAQRLTHLHLRLAARAEAEAHRLARERHRLLELHVALADLLWPGEVAQVHALELPVEVVVDLIGDERAERRQHLRHRQQACAQRAERARLAVPEAPPRAAHVPVGELVQQLRDRAARDRRVVRVQALGHQLRRRRGARKRPAVEVRQLLIFSGSRRRVRRLLAASDVVAAPLTSSASAALDVAAAPLSSALAACA